MPEGIRVRKRFLDGNTLTILATEEQMTAEMEAAAMEVHRRML
jgi:hypothetical protein